MKKRDGKKIQIIPSNRWLYTLITLGIIIIISVGVYALTAGTTPNPGHSISEMGVPALCFANQSVIWNGGALVCGNPPAYLSCRVEQSPSVTWAASSDGQGYLFRKTCSYGTLISGGCMCNNGDLIASIPSGGGEYMAEGWICKCPKATGNEVAVKCCN